MYAQEESRQGAVDALGHISTFKPTWLSQRMKYYVYLIDISVAGETSGSVF